MHFNDTHLDFLREKIMEMKIALFKSEINSELSLPTNIIETVSTDEEGNVYFFTACNGNYANNINDPFYAYLDYYKKGLESRLCISGKAVIVQEQITDENEELQSVGVSAKSIVLIKMKIMQAEFFGETLYSNQTWPQKIKNSFNHLFFPSTENHYKFG